MELTLSERADKLLLFSQQEQLKVLGQRKALEHIETHMTELGTKKHTSGFELRDGNKIRPNSGLAYNPALNNGPRLR